MDLERYNRHIILPEIGIAGQQKLLCAKVLVVGAGGLGSPVLMYLAAAGIGEIGIVDDDIVSLSNLQRQILYKTTEVNQLKAIVAKQRILENNPTLKIETYQARFTESNGLEIAKGYDLIVDCTDNYASRYVIDEVCHKLNLPMVYGSVSKFCGQVAVFNYNGGKQYKELFLEQPEIDLDDSSKLGVIGVLPGIIGSVQANEVIKIVIGLNDVLRNKLFLLDSKTMISNIVEF